MTKLGPAAEDVPSEGSPAKAMKSVFAGALESHPEVASAALRNPPKNLYHLPQSEDGISEPKENREKRETGRVNLFYFLDTPPKVHYLQLELIIFITKLTPSSPITESTQPTSQRATDSQYPQYSIRAGPK